MAPHRVWCLNYLEISAILKPYCHGSPTHKHTSDNPRIRDFCSAGERNEFNCKKEAGNRTEKRKIISLFYKESADY